MDKGATLHGCKLNCTILTRSFSAVLNTSYPDKALHYCLHLCALCILYIVPARSGRTVLLSAPCTQPRGTLFLASSSASQLQPAVHPESQLCQLQAYGPSPASCTYPDDFLFAYFTFATRILYATVCGRACTAPLRLPSPQSPQAWYSGQPLQAALACQTCQTWQRVVGVNGPEAVE